MKASCLGDAKTLSQSLSCHEQSGRLESSVQKFHIGECTHTCGPHTFFSWFLQRVLIFRLRFCESWLITGSL